MKHLAYRIVRCSLSCMLALLLVGGTVPAQSGASSIKGSVVDPQGQAVAGATVTLKSTQTAQVRTQITNDAGDFVFDLVPPGLYRVEAEAKGFKKAVIPEVRALVDKQADLKIPLEIGAITEEVTVSAAAGEIEINRQDASIGNNFVAQQITQLPLESRNVIQLLNLQPGVTPNGYVAGSRADQANITLDGIDVNEQQTGLDVIAAAVFDRDEAFSSVLRVTPDSVQEFRVTTTNANASQGRSSGAQVSLITKGGTNDFRGSLYEFNRNTSTTANDFFNNRSRIERPKLIRNLFGGSIGGPIRQDKLFFFFTYEGRRDASEQGVVRTVPLASLGRGELRYSNTAGDITTLSTAELNGLFPDVGINPAAVAVFADAAARFPVNDDTTGDGLNTGGFRFNAKTPLRWSTTIARLDFNLSDRHILFFRGNYQQDVIGRVPQFPDTPAPDFWHHPYGFALGHTWSISSTLVNNLRYGLTREAFTSQGDATDNHVFFRFVFSPRLDPPSRTLSRITPVHNITNDASWVKGQHSFQFGGNVRLIKNRRDSFSNSFDEALTNPSFYDQSGAVLTEPFDDIDPGFISPVRTAVSALVGRFSQYSANFNFDLDGGIMPVGTAVGREFATQEYDLYFQDSWRLAPNLTLNAGLRYSLSRPVYETTGFQVKPTVSLGDFFEQRKASAAQGRPFNDLITVDLAGPVHNRPGFYDWDKNNFQPRIAVAWSPDFNNSIWKKLFGSGGDSVIRGGFAITHDHIGQQLAVQFDLNNSLGFSSTQTIAANTFNVTTRPAPRFAGFSQNVRTLPGISVPSALAFPLITPPDEAQRIESSLDDTIITPQNYSWNVSYGRNLRAGLFVEASYIGRIARNLLATRDILALNNLVDSNSGLDWYTAAGMLADLRDADTPINRIRPIAYFENLFPGLAEFLELDPSLSATQAVYQLVAREAVGGFNILDWTFVQSIIDDASPLGRNLFFHPQYAAFATFSTIGNSDYHAGTLTIRQRFRNQLSWDLNYTFSRSIDDASGLQNSGSFGAAFILNPLRPQDNRAVSDFDITHIINSNAIWQVPVGRGKHFLSDANPVVDAILGGWQLSGIFRWNSGLPTPNFFDAAQWATNWNAQSNGVRVRPFKTSPTRGGSDAPKLFADPVAAFRSFRNARPGETGDRNVLRLPGFVSLDMGMGKSFTMPWSENHKLQFRWEVFNVTNTQRLTVTPDGATRDTFGLPIDPQLGAPPPSFANFDSIQGAPRVMQFGLRYTF